MSERQGVGVAHIAILIAVVALAISIVALVVATENVPTSEELKEANNSTTDPWDENGGGLGFSNPWFIVVSVIATVILTWKLQGPGL